MHSLILSYTKLSGLSNDRSYYLNLLDHVLFCGENMSISVNEKKERIRYVLVVITLNIHNKYVVKIISNHFYE